MFQPALKFVSIYLSVFALSLASCGRTDSMLSYESRRDQAHDWKIVPEYGQTSAILMSMGNVPLREKIFPGGYAQRLIDERMNLYNLLISSINGVRFTVLADPFMEHEGVNVKSEAQRLIKDQHGREIFWGNEDVDEGWPDEWARDYGPLSIQNRAGESRFLTYKNRGAKVLNPWLESTNRSFTEIADGSIEGGNIMTDSKGRCFFGVEPPKQFAEKYCTDSLVFGSLDFEGTGHIDIFAKLLSDDVAVVSRFPDELVEIISTISTTDSVCEQAMVDRSAWSECKFESYRASKDFIDIARDENGKVVTDVPDLLSKLSLFDLGKKENRRHLISGIGGRDIALTEAESPHWRDFTDQVASKLQNAGLKVVRVAVPHPVVKIEVSRYKSTAGQVVFEEVNAKVVFRSYTNSLISNNQVAVPTFQLADDRFNRDALALFKSLGLEPTGATSDYAVLGGGAVHCLTMQIK